MKTVSLINMKGGVAKTTLAIKLADSLATRNGERVLIIDVDPQFNATQCLLTPEAYIEHLAKKKDTVLAIYDRTSRPTASAVTGPAVAHSKALDKVSPIVADARQRQKKSEHRVVSLALKPKDTPPA